MLAYRDVQRAWRDDRWKLIRYPQVDVTQLFDIKNDRRRSRTWRTTPRTRARTT
ncbi:MAG: hypothetical protein HC814_04685 [Rhodobacteraceae bacterium]|nr:hypothetical protein [Paracoccaceae bacterium]